MRMRFKMSRIGEVEVLTDGEVIAKLFLVSDKRGVNVISKSLMATTMGRGATDESCTMLIQFGELPVTPPYRR